MAILALNKTTVKLITSTQIITSVFSVVKELVENSLDADAKNIEINLTDNGLSLIEIRDDGCGISIADVPNMAMPHYTSKIQNFSDLESLTTYGFRGEALNAICRVADVTVTTKTIHDETAKLYTLDNNGSIIDAELSHRFVGTTVRVQKLFENLPVRRQMITNQRKSRQEIKQIENLLKSLSICQPVVRISYRVNNSLVFLKPSCTSIKEALGHFLGSKVVGSLEWIDREDFEGKIQLMVPKQHLTDPHLVYEPKEQYIIINNRPVKYKQFEKLISERVFDHFGGKAPVKKHPVYLINVVVPPNEIDVNLEPNKTSVLLKNQDSILKKLNKILVDFYKLRDENMNPDMSMSNTSIDPSPEYQDSTQNTSTELEMPACKKPKLTNNKQRPRDSIVDLNTDTSAKRKGADTRLLNNGLATEIVPNSVMNNNFENMRINPQELNKTNEAAAGKVQAKGTESMDRDSIDRILKFFPGPVLSDSDDSTAELGAPRKPKETPLLIGHAVRSSTNAGKETIEFGQEKVGIDPDSLEFSNAAMICDVEMSSADVKPSDIDSETLSQLPIVDLGEDFDIAEILQRAPANQEITSSKEASHCLLTTFTNGDDWSKTDCGKSSTLELWSRGQIPGLKGSTDVSAYSDSRNSEKSSKNNESQKQELNSHTIYHTGFSKFSYEIRSQVLEENPGAALPTIGKIMANRWKELSSEERGYYRDLALEEKKNAEAEKKRLKNKQVSQKEAEKNKARLVQMLETMKKTKNNKKCSISERTTTPWEISIQGITKNFFSKQISEDEGIIGPLTDEIWAIKSDGKISVINSAEIVKKEVDQNNFDEQKTTTENTSSILQSWLRERKTRSPVVVHTICKMNSS